MISDDLQKQYLTYTQDYLEKLNVLQESLLTGMGNKEDIHLSLKSISHDIKGMGGSFGYDLMSDIGSSLNIYLRKIPSIEFVDCDIISQHLTAMENILNNNITGVGTDVEKAVIINLQSITSEFFNEEF